MIMSYNGHGDIVLVRSVSGETLAEYAYDEFGNVLAQNGELVTRTGMPTMNTWIRLTCMT